ncbi:fungal peroxidase [Mycena albidolilacea]|uniref:Fungal peroxidase n=1 Tax=Mycena albidolilacea TaxID=1033008 RepID=A0AAD7EM51_9AGAR|nr:fungal peroxidase [Mycena albidolilacea]
MKVNTLATFISFVFGVSAAGIHDGRSVKAKRATSILFNPPGLPPLPRIEEATRKANTGGLNLNDVQGDILIGMRKPVELFLFFGISNATDFKVKLKGEILPLVTTTAQILRDDTSAPSTLLNIAFSNTGLVALNATGEANNLNDTAFAAGQVNDVKNLSDPGTVNWVPQFVGTNIHGVILLASDTEDNINSTLSSLQSTLGDSISEIYSLRGAMRPPPNKGHEHFGFLDGISNPTLDVFQDSKPGQALVPAGEILVGQPGDNVTRPDWAKDGSFLVFRQLKQLVPEFPKFLADSPILEPGLSQEQGSDLLGARMVGRWKSGAAVFLSPMFDDPDLGRDYNRNNNFTFADPGQTKSNLTDQSKCPLSAHIRKTRPRADLGPLPENSTNHHMVRAGIPYGPEVTTDEASSNTTEIERGLAFVSYQSNIMNGFQFLQQAWANTPTFRQPGVGFDPIIGMLCFVFNRCGGAAAGADRPVNGLDPTDPARNFTLHTDFVVSRGGEYFFAPSLPAIANTLSL